MRALRVSATVGCLALALASCADILGLEPLVETPFDAGVDVTPPALDATPAPEAASPEAAAPADADASPPQDAAVDG